LAFIAKAEAKVKIGDKKIKKATKILIENRKD
jgi:hypothetical protein